MLNIFLEQVKNKIENVIQVQMSQSIINNSFNIV
jgi:hypothetical protein